MNFGEVRTFSPLHVEPVLPNSFWGGGGNCLLKGKIAASSPAIHLKRKASMRGEGLEADSQPEHAAPLRISNPFTKQMGNGELVSLALIMEDGMT